MLTSLEGYKGPLVGWKGSDMIDFACYKSDKGFRMLGRLEWDNIRSKKIRLI